jgi:hypothetical protein
MARKANDILDAPPPQLVALGTGDLETVRRILARATG